ncbi:unnamed protein product [Caenorhabditis angaria]|uniref:Uncharacterized protein n=1 Tax=Caenorhabditis angaria TaxID=860376 RepID=A0A9P1IGU4_9PELO|nr:unnamed protein product [Caenorhabditis angaria]
MMLFLDSTKNAKNCAQHVPLKIASGPGRRWESEDCGTEIRKLSGNSNTIQKLIAVPDQNLSIAYYSARSVVLFICLKKFAEYFSVLFFTWLIVPLILVWLYPHMVLELENNVVEWKPLSSSPVDGFKKTTIKMAGVSAQIWYNQTFLDEKVFWFIYVSLNGYVPTYSFFPDQRNKTVFCDATEHRNRRFTYQELISIVKICYFWVRSRIKKEDFVSLMAENHLANVALEAAIGLDPDLRLKNMDSLVAPKLYPNRFVADMYFNNPIADFTQLYHNNRILQWTFPIRFIRHGVIEYVFRRSGLTFSNFEERLEKYGRERAVHVTSTI